MPSLEAQPTSIYKRYSLRDARDLASALQVANTDKLSRLLTEEHQSAPGEGKWIMCDIIPLGFDISRILVNEGDILSVLVGRVDEASHVTPSPDARTKTILHDWRRHMRAFRTRSEFNQFPIDVGFQEYPLRYDMGNCKQEVIRNWQRKS